MNEQASPTPSNLDYGNFGVGLGTSLYNIYANERSFAAQQRQQSFNNDFLLNQYQYRAKDLEKAGLHPALALQAGAGAPVSATGHNANPVENASMTMQLALQKAQIRQMNSEAALVDERTRGEQLDNANKSFRNKELNPQTLDHLNKSIAALVANTRWQDYQSDVIGPTIKKLNESNANASDMRAAVDALEVAYIKAHGGNEKMPLTNNQWNLLEHLYATLSSLPVNQKVDSFIDNLKIILKNHQEQVFFDYNKSSRDAQDSANRDKIFLRRTYPAYDNP